MKNLCFTLLLVSCVLFAQQEEKSSKSLTASSLIQPISVTIGGNFIVTGSFVSFKTQRLDQFISTLFIEANQQAIKTIGEIQSVADLKEELPEYPLRDIVLKRISGETLKIDLLKFRLTGDFKDNPYLQNDDVIIFPAYDDERNFVDISGAVNSPVKFQFVDGDKLSDAILFAGGINKAFEKITEAEISRLTQKGTKENLVKVKITDNFELQRGDRIRILYDENNKLNFKVLVLGEVNTPGFVYVSKNGDNIADVINKSGGFTSKANLTQAEIVRDYNSIEMLKKNQIAKKYLNNKLEAFPEIFFNMKQNKELMELARLNNLVDEDTMFFSLDNQLRVLRSERLIDFTNIYDSTKDDSKFIVKDGDLILVPDKFDYVYVFGQVAKAGYVKYEPKKDYTYYIRKAGGLTETARDDEDEIVIVKGKEMNWITKNKMNVAIDPGDYIYIPKEIPRTFWYHFSRASSIISVLGSVATIILLITK